MEQTKKREIARAIMSDIDKLQMENHVLAKQNQHILDRLHDDAQKEIKSIFSEEEQRWIDEYVKDHKGDVDGLYELIDID